jgi:Na+/proline symporter
MKGILDVTDEALVSTDLRGTQFSSIFSSMDTLVIGVLGVALAFKVEALIFWFVLFAWSGLGSAFGPVVLCLLYYRKTTGAGVAAGMLAGFLTSVVWVLYLKPLTYDLYEALPGFVVGVLVTLLVSKLTSAGEPKLG